MYWACIKVIKTSIKGEFVSIGSYSFFLFEVYKSIEPKAMQRFRSLCLKALVPTQNYEVCTSLQSQPIETNQGKPFQKPSTSIPP